MASASDSEFVVEDYSPGISGRIRRGIDALQASLRQNVETVTRSSVIDIAGSGVEDIDPPEDIDEFHELYKNTGIVRANLNQFVSDVWKPGVRIEAESDATVAFFEGGDGAPDVTPEGGFLDNAFILNQTHQPFTPGGKLATLNRWTRGTNLIEYAKADLDDPDSEITGFKFIPPESVSARTYAGTNLLLDPDPDAERNQDISFDLTRRGEVAAWIQFDEQSILGRRGAFLDFEEDRPLSVNDILVQKLDPDIGGADSANETGIFGTSIIEAVNEDISEYNEIKRDRAKAIKTKAYGIWDATFNTEVIETPETAIVQEWSPEDQDEWVTSVEGIGPGEIIGHDGSIEFNKFEGSVPEVEDTLRHYVEDILSPLPAPKFLTGFEDDVNRDVTSEQDPRYQQTIDEERRYQEQSWTQALRRVAESFGLDTEGLRLRIEPPPEDSPILSLDQEEIEKINTWVSAASAAAGPTLGPTALFDEEFLRTKIFQVPEDAAPGGVDADADTLSAFDDEARETFDRLAGVDTYAAFDDGEVVTTPDGVGVIDDIITEGSVDGEDATEDDPVYAVVVEDESVGVGFYREDELSEGELPEAGPDDPAAELGEGEGETDTERADMYQEGFFEWPQSWKDSPEPARLIALRAWAGMGGSFRGCRREMRGNVAAPSRFCADFKDRLYGTEKWRGGWAD